MDSMKERDCVCAEKRDGMISLIVLAFLMTALAFPMISFLPVFAKTVFSTAADRTSTCGSCVASGRWFGDWGFALVAASKNTQGSSTGGHCM